MKIVRCSGIGKSWPWKGYPCGSSGKYTVDGIPYCGVHATAMAAKGGFKIAIIERSLKMSANDDQESTK